MAAVSAAVLAGCGDGKESPQREGATDVVARMQEARDLEDFTPFWLGEEFLGEPVSALDIQMDHPTSRGTMLGYGTCIEGGRCRGPAGVHTTDNPRAFGGPSDYVPMLERRGVPARISANKRSVTLATGKYVLIIGARDLETLEKAIAAVRPIEGELEDELPPPTFRVPAAAPE